MFSLNLVNDFHNTGKLMFAFECLEIKPLTAKECGNLALYIILIENATCKQEFTNIFLDGSFDSFFTITESMRYTV